jgi:hypothetical protein
MAIVSGVVPWLKCAVAAHGPPFASIQEVGGRVLGLRQAGEQSPIAASFSCHGRAVDGRGRWAGRHRHRLRLLTGRLEQAGPGSHRNSLTVFAESGGRTVYLVRRSLRSPSPFLQRSSSRTCSLDQATRLVRPFAFFRLMAIAELACARDAELLSPGCSWN